MNQKNYTALEWKVTLSIGGTKKIILMTSVVESEAYEDIAQKKIALRAADKYGIEPITVTRES